MSGLPIPPFSNSGLVADMGDTETRREVVGVTATENRFILRALARRMGIDWRELCAEGADELNTGAVDDRVERGETRTYENTTFAMWYRGIDIED